MTPCVFISVCLKVLFDCSGKQGLLAPWCSSEQQRNTDLLCCNCVVELPLCLSPLLLVFVSVWKAYCLCHVHLGRHRPLHTAQLRGPQRADCSSWLLNLLFPCSPVYWWASPILSDDLLSLLYFFLPNVSFLNLLNPNLSLHGNYTY